MNSGAPGYNINSAIKVGSLSTNPLVVDDIDLFYVNELKHGLRLRGADNEGQCYYVK
jgi:hypothetical protein